MSHISDDELRALGRVIVHACCGLKPSATTADAYAALAAAVDTEVMAGRVSDGAGEFALAIAALAMRIRPRNEKDAA